MASDSDAFAVDDRRVVHETIEGETILIHLDSGTYYSLQGSGSAIWELLAAGVPVGRAAELLAARHPREAESAAAELRRFADELLAEGLLVAGDPRDAPAPAALEADGAFAAPVLERYTDMQYFLLLDPVHDVDDSAGWPEPAPGAAGG